MEPIRYPQGHNMSNGCGCNTGNQRMNGYNPRQSQMQNTSGRMPHQPMPCMDRFNDPYEEFPIGMAYVPWQTWENLYPAEKALCEGTIFMDLNQIFCGKRGNRA